MNRKLLLKSSLRIMSRNKLRTLFMSIGVAVGVATLIAGQSLGTGATQQISERVEKMFGPASIYIFSNTLSYEDLEIRVEERTEELKIKSDSLEETNTALRVLLKRRDEDKAELEEKVLLNIQELVMPSLDKIRKTGLEKSQKSHLEVLESNLKDVISPFMHHLSMKHLKFTPSEIQISNLIKQGNTTKEIADYLNLSPRTVDFHRNKIRKKLGLNNEKANLRTHLLSIQ